MTSHIILAVTSFGSIKHAPQRDPKYATACNAIWAKSVFYTKIAVKIIFHQKFRPPPLRNFWIRACKYLADWASKRALDQLYNPKDALSFYSGRWNTGTNPDMAFANGGNDSRHLNRRIFEKFPSLNIDLRLLRPLKLWSSSK